MITNLDCLAISFTIAMISLVTIVTTTISFGIIKNKKQSYKLNTKNIKEG